MAMNPMQRRARNSFLTGMLVTLIIMAIVVVLLLYKINQLNEDKEKLLSLQKKYYVVADDIKSGEEITEESIVQATVQTTIPQDENLTPNDFLEVDEDSGEEFQVEYISKLDLPAGTIITKNMVSEAGDELTSDQRIQEYNMIILPSQLVNGNYIDIRFSLPSGADFIVLSKKKVLQCNTDTIWLKLSEDEILTLNNAIIEAYQAPGSKLYANTYIEAGLQESAVPTYPVNQAVMSLIERNPNIVQEARNALVNRYNNQEQAESRITQIDSAVVQNSATIQSGVQTEATALKNAREAFVSELEGTGSVGKTE